MCRIKVFSNQLKEICQEFTTHGFKAVIRPNFVIEIKQGLSYSFLNVKAFIAMKKLPVELEVI